MSREHGPRGAVKVTVDAAAAGQRLDAFVGRTLGVSGAMARRLIGDGIVRVDDRHAAKGAQLVKGTVVEIAHHLEPGMPVVPDAGRAIVFLYQDDALIAVDKPAGMASHPLRPGERGCVANGIVAAFPECAVASPDPREGGLAHRLDTPTSGVLIAARSRAVWTGLRRALGADDCEKRYLCQVWGAPPATGRIDVDIGRRGRRGGTVRTGGGRQPREAETNWSVLVRGARTVLVEARLHAGRPHQVRAHLAAAGYPIVGDDRYGEVRGHSASERMDNPGTQGAGEFGRGLRLHAASVRFRHPVTGALLRITSPDPAWAKPSAIG